MTQVWEVEQPGPGQCGALFTGHFRALEAQLVTQQIPMSGNFCTVLDSDLDLDTYNRPVGNLPWSFILLVTCC